MKWRSTTGGCGGCASACSPLPPLPLTSSSLPLLSSLLSFQALQRAEELGLLQARRVAGQRGWPPAHLPGEADVGGARAAAAGATQSLAHPSLTRPHTHALSAPPLPPPLSSATGDHRGGVRGGAAPGHGADRQGGGGGVRAGRLRLLRWGLGLASGRCDGRVQQRTPSTAARCRYPRGADASVPLGYLPPLSALQWRC